MDDFSPAHVDFAIRRSPFVLHRWQRPLANRNAGRIQKSGKKLPGSLSLGKAQIRLRKVSNFIKSTVVVALALNVIRPTSSSPPP
jgi:hypothetical protein